jgi:hypothetical protein
MTALVHFVPRNRFAGKKYEKKNIGKTPSTEKDGKRVTLLLIIVIILL